MKYTVVVADDEEEIRRSLVRRVKWEEIGFEAVSYTHLTLPTKAFV